MKHYKSVQITANAFEAKRDGASNIKVTIGTFFHNEFIGAFWIPISTYNKGWEVFKDAIISRAKRDLKITFDHNSSCGY